MKNILVCIYALLLSAAILALFWFLFPVTINSPKIALIVLIILLITSFGSGLRSFVEIYMLMPLALFLDKGANSTSAIIVFAISLIAAIIIPWVRGVNGWNGWQWVTAIIYTVISFETFYSFLCGLLKDKAGR